MSEWFNFLIRWVHLIAGISWIGSSFYFIWLDSHLTESTTGANDIEGELWMTHSGGFYQVLRKRIGPGTMPKTLHWFKYEALLTWISGTFLLGLIYYMTGGAYLVDPGVAKMTPHVATALGVGLLILSWIIYDLIWISLGKARPTLATGISLGLVAALAYLLCNVFSGRGAFIHLGAIFGTIMVANVWIRILPAQQKMIDATKEGKTPDFALSGLAKQRSVHNSYMTFPVLFTMLSNHYSMAYGNHWNWAVLLLLVVLGMCCRHVMIAKNGAGKWAIAPAIAALAAMMALSSTLPTVPGYNYPNGHFSGERIRFEQAQAVIRIRCVVCHSAHPADATFGPMPGGVQLDSAERIKNFAERIRVRAVITKTMPLANKTGMTEDERMLLARWLDEGASIEP